MSSPLPKAVLYYNPKSIWASVALLALAEKGYGEDEFDLRVVNLNKGENLSLSFLRINPKGTIPALVVPLEKTLSPESEHRFKAVTDSKAIVEFLDKSRSTSSRTQTTSSAPAPTLTPATIALSSTANNIIDLLHSEDGSPNILTFHNAIDLAALRSAAPLLTPNFVGRYEAVCGFIRDNESAPISASEKTRKLWADRKERWGTLLAVYSNAAKEDADLTLQEKEQREAYFAKANTAWHVKLKNTLTALDGELIGPYTLGDQVSIADIHLAAWFTRVATLAGASATDSGDVVVSKVETRVGGGFSLPKSFQTTHIADAKVDPALAVTPGAKRAKLAAFWDAMTARPSWEKVYAGGLH